MDKPHKAEVRCRCWVSPYRDIATMDEQGFCKIVGRSKDMIIRGGENIYPAELEDFFHKHPQVQEVQVRHRESGAGTPGLAGD